MYFEIATHFIKLYLCTKITFEHFVSKTFTYIFLHNSVKNQEPDDFNNFWHVESYEYSTTEDYKFVYVTCKLWLPYLKKSIVIFNIKSPFAFYTYWINSQGTELSLF